MGAGVPSEEGWEWIPLSLHQAPSHLEEEPRLPPTAPMMTWPLSTIQCHWPPLFAASVSPDTAGLNLLHPLNYRL